MLKNLLDARHNGPPKNYKSQDTHLFPALVHFLPLPHFLTASLHCSSGHSTLSSNATKARCNIYVIRFS